MLVRGLYTVGLGAGLFINVLTDTLLSVETLLLLFGLLTLVDGGLLLLTAVDITERRIDSWWLTTSDLFGLGRGLILLGLAYRGTGGIGILTILLAVWTLSAGTCSYVAGYVLVVFTVTVYRRSADPS